VPIFDYTCSAGHTAELLRPAQVVGVACPTCARMARRNGVNVGIGVVGPTTDTRGMYRRFTEASAEIDAAATRHERDHGQRAALPNLWGIAKTEAAARVAAGEAPPARKAAVT
jgi:hypothetical protein